MKPGVKSDVAFLFSCRPRRPTYLAPTTVSPTASPSYCGGASYRTTALSCSASSTRLSGRSSGTTTTAATTASSATPRRGFQEKRAPQDHPGPRTRPASSSTSRGRLAGGRGADTGGTKPASTARGPLPLLMTPGPPRFSKVNIQTYTHACIHSFIYTQKYPEG